MRSLERVVAFARAGPEHPHWQQFDRRHGGERGRALPGGRCRRARGRPRRRCAQRGRRGRLARACRLIPVPRARMLRRTAASPLAGGSPDRTRRYWSS